MAFPGGGLRRLARRGVQGPEPGEILAALSTPVLVIDPDGQLLDMNAAAETLLNLSRPTALGRQIEALIGHPLTTMPPDAPVAAYDLTAWLPDGRELEVDLTVSPLPDRAGHRVVTVASRPQTHIAARQEQRQGGKLAAVGAAAILAHEIKNPLSAIRGAAQLLDGNDATGGEMTRLIRDEVDRIAALIDRMEQFTDTRALPLGAQNIHAILAHVREVALWGFAKGRTIRQVYDPSLPEILGDRDSLVQIFLNLLKNAAEASEKSTLTLTTAYRHGVTKRLAGSASRTNLPIECCVIDDGPGAPAGLAEHLFDPFVTTKRQGSGLGLALVDKLVTDQGGLVEYAREGTPPRTVFRLLLQRAPMRAEG